MGTNLSKEQAFIKDLKSSLRERGVKIKKKDLVRFFLFIDDVCPWFIVNGPEIHPAKWQKVGRDLNNKLKTEGPESVPIHVLSYWNLINDIVEYASLDGGTRQLLISAESCLRLLSRAASTQSLQKTGKPSSPPPSGIIEIPSVTPKSIYPPLPKEGTPPVESNLAYPVFPAAEPKLPVKNESETQDALSSSNVAELESEAAGYIPPPHSLPLLTAPILNPPVIPAIDLITAMQDLTEKVKNLQEVLDLQTQYLQMMNELSALQQSLQRTLSLPVSGYQRQLPKAVRPLKNKKNPSSLTKIKNPAPAQLAFPELRSQKTSVAPKETEEEGGEEGEAEASGEEEGVTESSDQDSEAEIDVGEGGQFKSIKFKSIKDLHSAVKAYGPNAPFTLSALEAIGQGGYLLPGEWIRVVQAVLSRGQFLSWKADFFDRCEAAQKNNLRTASTKSWTFDKIAGQGKYAAESKQRHLPLGLLAQTAAAATGAWRALPPTGSPFVPLNKVLQGNQEDFSEFVSRLLETAERTLGAEAANDQNVKRLAYMNANAPCRAVLRGQWKEKTLNDMIKLCRDIDPASTKMSQAVHLAISATFQNGAPRTCFKCGMEGHFAKQCPANLAANPARRAAPTTPCPKCKKGFHWANTCRSTHDVAGNPIPPPSGNGKRGQPRTPQGSAQPATGTNLPSHNYTGQLQGAQGWTCVPPPTQY
ncbi:endogenous retrovirus group K member 8 Gag polyprotein-like [Antechinus flavipes]|uniref:endogenous retrovirus group K member 8 Gag polyprotein-like n=1 Tax=Antechinus flavipes TaxID=38775 RepID=UPI0022364141|nr:endogenous retrovirus group K member 8 Gag polyprotein-like [Antechinus flavipes]